MTQPVRTPAITRADRKTTDDLDGGLTVSPADPGKRLWHFFISMRTGLALMLGLAVLGFIGTLLVQADPGLQGDRQAYAVWLETVRPKYGGWTGVFDALGLFSVFSSIWFRGIVVLLTMSLLACSVNRAPRLWKRAVHPRTNMSETFFAHAPLRASIATAADPGTALAEVQTAFRARHFRTIVNHDGDTIHLYADRFRWGPFGTVIAHLSLTLILAGALIGTAWGFRNNSLAVPVGSRVEVGYGTGMSIEAKSFTDSYYTNGSPSDFASDLVLYMDGVQVIAQTVRVNEPLRAGDVTFYQSFYGAAAVMTVADPTGRVVFDRGVPLEWATSDDKYRVGQIILPDAGLTAYVVGATSGEVDPRIKPGQMQIEVYRSGLEGEPIATEIISQGQPANIAELDFTFVRERQFTGLIVARDPGAVFVWIGAGLLVSGISLVFLFPGRRAWARIQRRPNGSSIQVGAIVRHDVTFRPDFQHLVDDIELALTGSSPT
ncbi:MAG: cytochrome c biogenesis protein ResB [Chloroflexota bacterium]